MKIIVISNVSGGLFSFRRELLELLAKENTVTILASDTGHVDQLKAMGCAFVEVPMDRHGTNPLKELQLVVHYMHLLKQLKPDVVLTYTIKPNIYAGMACASLGVRYIANITGLGTAVENSGKAQKLMLGLYRYGLRKAQKVFFQNKANMDFLLAKKVVRGPYELIPGSGVNLTRYQVLEYPHGDTIDFTYIGRVIKQKGIDQYLDAAKAIRETHPETRFHICGRCDPAYEATIRKLNDNGTVVYHGLVDDIAGMHAVSCCTIHPSYYPEGMSNVLLESCACGRPIITTDRPGCGEIVDDGINGFVVKQKDSKDLITKIGQFLNLSWEEKKKMGLAGRLKVEKEFDRRIVIEKYLEEVERDA